MYDVVLCPQCLEHVENAATFAAKLFACASRLVVITVPYKWGRGSGRGHIHDPVEEKKLDAWTGLQPTSSIIVDRGTSRRLVAAYRVRRS